MTDKKKHPQYGIDAPGLVSFFFISSAVTIGIIIAIQTYASKSSTFVSITIILFILIAAYFLGMGSFMIYFSKITKVREREKLLDLISWSGDEVVLDVGCGRGLMLVGVAKRLNISGRVIGIDIWQQKDQTHNNSVATLENAQIEGVADRVEVNTADMRMIPFPENHFDVIVSNWAIHNLDADSERKKTLDEIIRVLKPKGRLLICDIAHQDEYAKYLTKQKMSNVEIHNNVFRDKILKAITFGAFAPSVVVSIK